MKYYIATSTARASHHNLVRDLLKEQGHELVYDWTAHGSVRETSVERLRAVATVELQSIANADFVLVLLPGGKGTHTELGFSLACKKAVLVHSEDPLAFEIGPEACAFYHHPDVVRLSCPIENVAQMVQSVLVASI